MIRRIKFDLMTWSYWVYGLGLETDRPIPGLTPVNGLAIPDVKVSLEGWPPWSGRKREPSLTLWHINANRDAQGEPVLRVWLDEDNGFFRLRYSDGVEFGVDRQGTQVWAGGPEGTPLEYLAVYLLGPVLGFVLRLRGITCLHASAIAVGNQALAFLGPPGAGKSTLAAVFALSGYPVLADDVSPLREEGGAFLIGPGLPRLCLWPKAVAHLFGSPQALPLLIPPNELYPDWDKQYLALNGGKYRFHASPLALAAIYILGESRADGGLRVERVEPATGLLTLVANTYRTELLDKDLRGQEFGTLARLAAQIPLRRVASPGDLNHLPRLCRTILEDFHSLPSPACRPETNQSCSIDV
jgi:hypothetical protein